MRRPLLVVLAALVFTSGAAAATFSFTASTTPVTVPTVTLSGVDQTKTFTIANTVAYTGGNNTAGWKVQASATAPTDGTTTLPAIAVTAGSAACQGTCASTPTTGLTYPLTLSTTAQTIFHAGAGTGQGTFTVTSTFQLDYAANLFPTTFTSTVTLTGSTGP